MKSNTKYKPRKPYSKREYLKITHIPHKPDFSRFDFSKLDPSKLPVQDRILAAFLFWSLMAVLVLMLVAHGG